MKKNKTQKYLLFVVIFIGGFFLFSNEKILAERTAKTTAPLEIAGWVPYWRTATGTEDAIAHIDSFKEISPFGYTVKKDGSLYDAMNIESEPWQNLIKKAKEKKVRVIPTVMWSDTENIDKVLRDPVLRKNHITAIMAMVGKHNFDGVDIDYESKKAETKNYFSLFLKELYKAAGKKFVICTIEPRTPLIDRFNVIPKDIAFANDYAEINKYCDRVRIMAYDQRRIDLRLNEKITGLYSPVADVRWVEKVIRLAMKEIDKKKIVIGIPTYGYEYKVTPLEKGFSYDLLWSFNPRYGLDIANQYKITPTRNEANELSLAYIPIVSGQAMEKENAREISDDAISLSSNKSETTKNYGPSFNLMWWSDAKAIKTKVDLAKKLGVRGVAIFKIDGGEDPAMWDILK